MTQRIGAQAQEILAAVEALARTRTAIRQAKFAEDYNCVEVKLSGSQKNHVETAALGCPRRSPRALHNARTLCSKELKAKRLSVVPHHPRTRSHPRRPTIITGPTPAEKPAPKTVASSALMSQSGLPVPADRAELPIFDAVLADIGDYQSSNKISRRSPHTSPISISSRARSTQTRSCSSMTRLRHRPKKCGLPSLLPGIPAASDA